MNNGLWYTMMRSSWSCSYYLSLGCGMHHVWIRGILGLFVPQACLMKLHPPASRVLLLWQGWNCPGSCSMTLCAGEVRPPWLGWFHQSCSCRYLDNRCPLGFQTLEALVEDACTPHSCTPSKWRLWQVLFHAPGHLWSEFLLILLLKTSKFCGGLWHFWHLETDVTKSYLNRCNICYMKFFMKITGPPSTTYYLPNLLHFPVLCPKCI